MASITSTSATSVIAPATKDFATVLYDRTSDKVEPAVLEEFNSWLKITYGEKAVTRTWTVLAESKQPSIINFIDRVFKEDKINGPDQVYLNDCVKLASVGRL
jgi:hypothetical protein